MEILELENTVTEVQGSTDSSDNSYNMAEKSEMEDRSVENIQTKAHKLKGKRQNVE